MDETKPTVKGFLKSLDEKKSKRLITARVLETYPDGSVSVLLDEVPWRISQKTLEKLKTKEPLRGGVNW